MSFARGGCCTGVSCPRGALAVDMVQFPYTKADWSQKGRTAEANLRHYSSPGTGRVAPRPVPEKMYPPPPFSTLYRRKRGVLGVRVMVKEQLAGILRHLRRRLGAATAE